MTAAYAAAAATSMALAAWCTFFPFDFQKLAVEQAVASLARPTLWKGPAWSPIDLMSNVLLFAPIGLFLCPTIERTRGGRPAAIVVLGAALLFSLVIEVAQAFVVWRTPSVLDVLAQLAGTAAGIAIWRAARDHIDRVMQAALSLWQDSTHAERLLLVYTVLFAAAWLFPFDVTLRPSEIADKYQHKRLLLPFAPSPDAATRAELVTVLAASVPIGWAAVLCGAAPPSRRRIAPALGLAASWLIALELLQALVFSRTTDATVLLAAMPGAALGVASAARRELWA